ncbi:MAG TPA: hypothetical protein VHC18_21155 [Amycolatopsis sp.]|nr:hypothetical protein [Amycolatopsis sp.]
MTEPQPQKMINDRTFGFWVVIGGLTAMLVVALPAIFVFRSSSGDAAAVITAAGTVIGTLVGAFFGVHVGAAAGAQGTKQAESARQEAEAARQQAEAAKDSAFQKLSTVAAVLDPGSEAAKVAQEVMAGPIC